MGINLTALAQAEVAQPKNDLTERFQVAQPKIKSAPVPEQTEISGTVSMTKEELAQHPDLIVRGLIPAVLQNNEQAVEIIVADVPKLAKARSVFA